MFKKKGFKITQAIQQAFCNYSYNKIYFWENYIYIFIFLLVEISWDKTYVRDLLGNVRFFVGPYLLAQLSPIRSETKDYA